jgi:hypothetical protein
MNFLSGVVYGGFLSQYKLRWISLPVQTAVDFSPSTNSGGFLSQYKLRWISLPAQTPAQIPDAVPIN